MAAEAGDDDFALAPAAGPLLARAQAPWLADVREQLGAQQEQGRLPHGILLTGAPGAGQAEIGTWLAARVLCRGSSDGKKAPCGACPDCRLFEAGSHPDFHWLGVLPDKKDISIDQVRALSGKLTLRSYRGGAKATLVAPAEAMNAKSFNALLKTLEEPAAETFIVLAASRIDRIPKTIMSRTQRLRLPLPATAAALAWLRARSVAGDLEALLALAGGSPFLAAEHADAGLGELDTEMREAIAAAEAGRLDIVAFADKSAKDAPSIRLAWLESWLTRSLKEAALGSDLVNNNRLPWLRPPGADRKIRAGYSLLDELREARRQAGGPLNMQLLFEGLSVSLATLVGRPPARTGERTD